MKNPKQASKGPKRPTLKTIAELTGLSLSTVSLALRDPDSLKRETSERVHTTAREIGYVPDRAGVRLRTGRTNVIALVMPGNEESIGFSRRLVQGIGQALKDTQYHLTVMPEFGRDDENGAIRYIVENRTADGLVLTHTLPRDSRVQYMLDADYPFVTNGRTEFFTPHPFHDFHAEEFARLAVERLVGSGCKHLGLVIGEDGTMNRQNIINAFNRALTEASVSGQVYPAGRGSGVVEDLCARVEAEGTWPDGFVCNEELVGVMLNQANTQNRLAQGRAVQIVSRENSGILSTLFPEADSIEEDLVNTGQELARILMRRIAGDAVSNELQTLGHPITHWRH